MELKDETKMAIAKFAELSCGKIRHVDTVYPHLSTIGSIERTEDLQKRGLPGSAGTHDANNFALVDV